jgi:hypothetical protein
MLGAIAGSGLFPFKREDYEAVVKAGGKGAEASLRGFAKAFDIVAQGQGSRPTSSRRCWRPSRTPPARWRRRRVRRRTSARRALPAPVQEMFGLGYARLLEYQGQAYADLYVQRLQRCWRPSAKPTRRRARPRHHARDGALAGAVDGLRRHRARGRPQEPRLALDPRAGRSEGRATTTC